MSKISINLNDPINLHPIRLGQLLVKPKHHPRGQSHLSAASGLVRLGNRWYVIADDELHLGIFEERPKPASNSRRFKKGRLFGLLAGTLPDGPEQRKAAKPDFESLALLPAFSSPSTGVLFALGSGSKPNRHVGVVIELDQAGDPSGRMAHIDLTKLYAPLRKQFADLNIEGAFLMDDQAQFLLLHRGNKGDARSACIRYDWPLLKQWLIDQGQGAEHQHQPPEPTIQIIELANVDGVPLSLTDGAALPDGTWVFSAAAEATNDSVQDGACVGSAVGIISRSGEMLCTYLLQGKPKVEGIYVRAKSKGWQVTMVTDADDPAIASQLLRVKIPRV